MNTALNTMLNAKLGAILERHVWRCRLRIKRLIHG